MHWSIEYCLLCRAHDIQVTAIIHAFRVILKQLAGIDRLINKNKGIFYKLVTTENESIGSMICDQTGPYLSDFNN
jgi:hypothetical protein